MDLVVSNEMIFINTESYDLFWKDRTTDKHRMIKVVGISIEKDFLLKEQDLPLYDPIGKKRELITFHLENKTKEILEIDFMIKKED